MGRKSITSGWFPSQYVTFSECNLDVSRVFYRELNYFQSLLPTLLQLPHPLPPLPDLPVIKI